MNEIDIIEEIDNKLSSLENPMSSLYFTREERIGKILRLVKELKKRLLIEEGRR